MQTQERSPVIVDEVRVRAVRSRFHVAVELIPVQDELRMLRVTHPDEVGAELGIAAEDNRLHVPLDLAGEARMTVFAPSDRSRTMDFNANDVGFLPAMAGHYIENTGDEDLIFLEIIRADQFIDFSLNNWLRHLPPEMVTAHLNLDEQTIRKIPSEKLTVIAG